MDDDMSYGEQELAFYADPGPPDVRGVCYDKSHRRQGGWMPFERPVLSYTVEDGWKFRFGKYTNQTVEHVASQNLSYIGWALEDMGPSLTEDERKVFNVYLGKLPKESLPRPLMAVAQPQPTPPPPVQLELKGWETQLKREAAKQALAMLCAATQRVADAEYAALRAREDLQREKRIQKALEVRAKELTEAALEEATKSGTQGSS